MTSDSSRSSLLLPGLSPGLLLIHLSNLGLLFHAHGPEKQLFTGEKEEASGYWFRVFQGAFDMIKGLCSHMGLSSSELNKGK